MVFTIIILAHGDWLLLSQHTRTLCASPLTLASAACRAASASCVSRTESGCFHVFLQRSRFESVWKRWPCSKSSHFTRTKQDKIDASMCRCVDASMRCCCCCVPLPWPGVSSPLQLPGEIKDDQGIKMSWQNVTKIVSNMWHVCQSLWSIAMFNDTFWHVLTRFDIFQKCSKRLWRVTDLTPFEFRQPWLGCAQWDPAQIRALHLELSEITTGPPLLFLPPW